jgi:hypothetical protein
MTTERHSFPAQFRNDLTVARTELPGSGGGKLNISGITSSEICLRIIKILEP